MQAALIVAGSGVVHIALNAASERGGQRVFLIGESFIVLIERFGTNLALRAEQKLAERGVRQFDLIAVMDGDFGETQIRII